MTGVTKSGLAVSMPSRRNRRRLEPISDDEARRMRVRLAQLLAEAGYTVRDRAKILCVPRSTLNDLETELAPILSGGAAGEL